MKDIQTYIDEQIKQNNEELLSKILKMITPLETNNAKTDSRAKRWFMRNKQNLIVFAVCFVIFSVIFHMLYPKKVAPEAAIYEIQQTQAEYDWHNWRTGMCTFEYFRSGQTEKDLELIIKKWINYQDR